MRGECKAKECESIGCVNEALNLILLIVLMILATVWLEKKVDEAKAELKADIIAIHRELKNSEASRGAVENIEQ